MNNNKVLFGDCLELMKDIEDKSIDMILCDLPYGTTKNKWDVIIPFIPLWAQYSRIIKNNGAIVLFGSQPFTSELILSNRKMFRYSLVWQKTSPTGHLNAKKMHLRAHEDICVFYKKSPVYNPQKTTGHKRKVSTSEHKRDCVKTSNYGEHGLTSYDSTERYPISILKYKTDKQKLAIHSTQKPVALFKNLIQTYTNEGEVVLDNCAGSGTTGVACEECNRNYILMENDIDSYVKMTNRLKH